MNPFSEITLQGEAAQAELKRRQQANEKIRAMNAMLASNPGNKNMQNALMEQYFGMVFPEEPDYESEANKAITFMQLGQQMGNDQLYNMGMKMLAENPMMKQYGFGQETTPMSPEESDPNSVYNIWKTQQQAEAQKLATEGSSPERVAQAYQLANISEQDYTNKYAPEVTLAEKGKGAWDKIRDIKAPEVGLAAYLAPLTLGASLGAPVFWRSISGGNEENIRRGRLGME